MALNTVRQRATDLWLDFIPEGESLNWLSKGLTEWLPLPEFYDDYSVVHYDLLRQFEKFYGLNAAIELMNWCDNILIKGGPDRVSEQLWWQVIMGDVLAGLEPGIGSKAVKLKTELFSNCDSRKKQMRVKNDEITDAEKNLLSAHWSDVESLDSGISLIATSNQFVLAWQQIMGDASIEQLRELYSVGKEAVKQMPGGADPMMLGFPGTWPSLLIAKQRSNKKAKKMSIHQS